jgi:hypothetical protein
VAQGFSQKPGIDFGETYAPVARMTSIRAFLSVVAIKDLELEQADVVTAFLNGKLSETIYMKQPEGYEANGRGHLVCKLSKSLYGLKQAPKVWADELRSTMRELDFLPLDGDDCLYRNKMFDVFIVTYVDDMAVAAPSKAVIDDVLQRLEKKFKLKRLGSMKRFLGLEISRDREKRTIHIKQSSYAAKVLERFGMNDSKPTQTPMDRVQLCPGDDEFDVSLYQQAIGSVIYLTTMSRPDLAYAVGTLAMFCASPSEVHWNAFKRLCRYIQGTKDYALVLGGGDPELVGFTDASYGDTYDFRSTGGHVFKLGGGTISWSSKRQGPTAASTTESEYVQASEAAKEAIWLQRLIEGFGVKQGPIKLHGDNRSAIALAKNGEFHSRTKHIGVRYHFIRHAISDGHIDFAWVPTDDNLADIMTKALQPYKFAPLVAKLNLVPDHPPRRGV